MRAAWLVPMLWLLISGCDEQTQAADPPGVGSVTVTLRGLVRSAETDLPVEGIVAELVREDTAGTPTPTVVQAVGTSDADGRFGPSAAVTIQPEDFRYALRLRDSQTPARYQENAATTVFALVASDLRFDNLRLTPIDTRVRTVIAGSVVDSRTDAPLAGVKVTLTREGEEAPLHEATSAADGKYAFEGVLLEALRLDFDGRALAGADAPLGYIAEYAPFQPRGEEALHDLGPTRLVPASARQDLSVLLDWRHQTPEAAPFARIHNLDAVFSLTRPDVDFNHLFGRQLDMAETVGASEPDAAPVTAADLAVSPASGFAADTGYWPGFLGGNDRHRVAVGAERDPPAPDACPMLPARVCRAGMGELSSVELLRTSSSGEGPESLVFRQLNPLSAVPAGLAYHYTYGDGTKHFPVGLGVFTAVARPVLAPEEPGGDDPRRVDPDIHRSEAVAKVYLGSTFVGRFDIGETVLPPGEDNNRTWTPFVVEYGFTTPDPASDEDVYFRVVPFTALRQGVRRRFWMYEDRGAQRASLAHAWTSLPFDGVLYVAGSAGDAFEPKDRFGLWYLGLDASGEEPQWEWIPDDALSRAHDLRSLGLLNGAFVASFRDARAPDESYFGQLTGSQMTLRRCPAARAMMAASGDYLLATDEGLFSGLDCEDRDRPHLRGAPEGSLRALAVHRFAAGPRMLLGGEGTGLWSSPPPDREADPPTPAAWAAGAPGLSEAGDRAPPAGATITSIRSVEDALFVGTAAEGLFMCWRQAPSGRADEWQSLNEGADGVPPGWGFPWREGDEPVAVTALEVVGDALFVGTDRGLVVWRTEPDGTSRRFSPIYPSLPIEHIAPYGKNVYLFTPDGVVVYR